MVYQNSSNINNTALVAADGSGVFNGRTITGTADFIDLTDGSGVSGNPTVSIANNFETTGMHGWNGSILESPSVTVTSDGATITCSVERSGGGNLTVVFSDGYYDWTTAPDTVTLAEGSDTVPLLYYVYFLKSTLTLTASTAGWPATEHAPICTTIVQTAASLQTDGPYKMHAWTDHVTATDEQGHVGDINFWIRQQPATWKSGVVQSFNIVANGGAPDNVNIDTTSGVVLQLHTQAFPAFTTVHDYYTINDSVTPYNVVTDLNALLTDSTGVSMSGRYFSLVIWGVVSEDTGDCKIFVNLPGGSYNTASGVTTDADKYADFDIPEEYIGTGFLIAQWNLRHQVAAGGTWTSIDEIDLRGLVPSLNPGGSASLSTEFPDNTFRIFDDGDDTKKLAFEVSTITPATTRTITAADYDIDLATVCISATTDAGTATPALGTLDIVGSHGINTTGATNVVTVQINNAIALGDLSVIGAGSNALTCTTGDIQIAAGNLNIPLNTSANLGVIERAGTRFIHTYPSATNFFAGSEAGNFVISGGNNTSVGYRTLDGMTSGATNTAVGSLALSGIVTANGNTAVGGLCMQAATGEGNTALGTTALFVVSGDNNIAIGPQTLAALSTGSENLCIGFFSCTNLTTGDRNICIGYNAGINLTLTDSDNLYIGSTGTTGDNNTMRLGTQGTGTGQQDTTFIAGVANVAVSNKEIVTIDTTTGQLGSEEFSGIFTWNVETGTSANMAVNNGYIGNNAGTVAFKLPTTAAVGDIVRVTAIQGAWSITQNGGETIYFGSSSTTTGVGGSLTSTDTRDAIELVCVVANTDWNVLSSVGNITVV